MRTVGRKPPWHPVFAIVAIAGGVVGATMIGGPPAGMGASFIAAATIVTIAARAKPEGTISVESGPSNRILVLACAALDQPHALEPIHAAAATALAGEPEALVVAPASVGRLASITSDIRAGQVSAAERLAVALAGFAAADIEATGRVGDSDPLAAAEDALRTWPAGQVVFIHDAADDRAARAAAALGKRSPVPVRVVRMDPEPGVR